MLKILVSLLLSSQFVLTAPPARSAPVIVANAAIPVLRNIAGSLQEARRQFKPRPGRASEVAKRFYMGMPYPQVVGQIGQPDLRISRKLFYRWGQGDNYMTVGYTEDGVFAGSGVIQLSGHNPLREADIQKFRQLVNRDASYAEFLRVLGEADRRLYEVEYGWLHEDTFLRMMVMDQRVMSVFYGNHEIHCCVSLL